jgi:DNA-binding beta-propeller fold protein YncE
MVQYARPAALASLLLSFVAMQAAGAGSFTAFESGQVRPLAMTPDGSRLLAVNTPDNRLEIFAIGSSGLAPVDSVPVGLEPVAVAVRGNGEAWVVNHLSDSISIVNLGSSPARVTRTLLVGDEPRDIVFAGPGGNRAFITTAHRGQNSPYSSATNPGELTTPGIGRADVWVFDANAPDPSAGGAPPKILTLFGDTPRALAATPDGSRVYAAVFHSGNRTTTINDGAVCNGGAAAAPCVIFGTPAPGGLPAPNVDANGAAAPKTGLIVRHDGTHWVDELGRNWDDMVRFNLPDFDVFAIDANATPPAKVAAYPGVGTVLFNMAVNPATGRLYVSNTEAQNQVRFEGTRPTVGPGSNFTTVLGRQHQTRITVIDPATDAVTPRHLNKHIDYAVSPAPASVRDRSLALPRGIAVTTSGQTIYMAAQGSGKIGVFTASKIEDGSFVPDAASHIVLSGGGPTGLVLDEPRNRLYAMTRFDNGISIVNLATRAETHHYRLPNPEPAAIVNGRPFLYDANLTSSNGEAACGSCHVDGDLDSLAWDLGNPLDTILTNPLQFTIGPIAAPPLFYSDFHPLKGPMTTQTLRGMANHGSMHWRGDRTAGNDPGGDSNDENGAFLKFNGAFPALLGRATPLTAEQMQSFADFMLAVTPPPNPIRELDDSLTAAQMAGRNFYFNDIVDTRTCNGCHVLDPASGFFGGDGKASFEGESQHFKIPHLRNMYAKVGMFGMPRVNFLTVGDHLHAGDQIRGFGFLHDGSIDTMRRFFRAIVFTFPLGDVQRNDMEQFMFAMDSNLKPIVGQQVTLHGSNAASAGPRIDRLIARAAAGDCELVVKGLEGGVMRGWLRQAAGTFTSDFAGDPALTDGQMRAKVASAGVELTYLCVPPGSGTRIAIDRDEDAVLDANDVCPAVADASQADTDADLVGNACDNCSAHANGDQRDTNGDGYGNACDIDLDNNGATNTLDLNIYKLAHRSRIGDANYNPDADFNGDGRVSTLDLNVFRALYRQLPGPSCCGN